MNAALRKALAASQLTETDVAAHLRVDPKTVRRWLSGQRPYPRHRWALAHLLQTEERDLWPESSQSTKDSTPPPEHALRVYAHRWQVPREVWWGLFNSAEQEIGILAYSAIFLADDPGLVRLIGARARGGVNVRILLGNPESIALQRRGAEEGIEDLMSARAKNAKALFRRLQGEERVETRLHSTTLYNSMYLSEGRMLVNAHIFGTAAAESPVLEIDRQTSPEVAQVYEHSFENVWRNSHEMGAT